jgi:ATP-dependent helicase/nuclease subunit A
MSKPPSLVEATGLSDEQAPAVLARGRDVVVTAGAGAGKTRTLVGRYLALLESGIAPRRIAAITFTRKAAREMRNRVRDELASHVQRFAPGTVEAQRWEQIQTSLDAARIGTIHELCSQILRTHPAEAGVDPRFRMLEEGNMAWLQSEAVTDSLAWAVDQPQLYPLFQQIGPAILRAILTELLRQGKTRLPPPPEAEAQLQVWESQLQRAQGEAVTRFLARDDVAAAREELAACLPLQGDDHLANLRAAVLEAFAAAARAGWQPLSILSAVKLGQGRQSAWAGGKADKQRVTDSLKTLRDRWEAGPGRLPAACHEGDRLLASLQAPLAELAARAEAFYRARKAEWEALDFDDLEQMALDLLREEKSVLAYWQQQLDAILVDEYQDTNDRQRQIINLLSGRRGGLFIVGDGKQSIYRFRGADVSVFREEQERIAAGGGTAQELSTSYRPHAALLDMLNRLLPALMDSDTSANEPWRIPFAPLRHVRETPAFAHEGPFVAVDLAVGNKDEALPRAAAACAARIESMRAQHEALRYQDIAILCRSSGSFAYYEDALESRGIPYQTIAGRGFYDRAEVRDLLNALHAVLEPTDDLALYGLLRSPVIGFSDAALYQLRRRQLDGGVPTLWAALHADESRQGRRAVQLVEALHRSAGRSTATAILQRLLEETDYLAALQLAGEGRAARNVAKLLADAQQSGLVQLGDFLTYVRDVEQQVRSSEARATVDDAVQIMSVHQAKGLEFPVVIIGDVNHQGARRGSGPLVKPESGVLFKVGEEDEPAILTLAKQSEQAQEEAESDRIFYVAATRARDMLLLNGNVGVNNGRPRPSGWLKQLFPAFGLDETGPWEPEVMVEVPAARVPSVACTVYGQGFAPPPAPERASLPPPVPAPWQPALIRPVAPPQRQPQAEQQPMWRIVPAVEYQHAPAWVVGTLLHEALAAWRFPASADDGAFQQWAAARARSLGVADTPRLADAARQVARLLLRLAGHPLYARLANARRLSELPFVYEDEEGLHTGTIDLLFEDADGWHLVEFKSDRVSDVATCAERPAYEAQMQRYARAVGHLLGLQPDCTICWLGAARGVVVQTVPVPAPKRAGTGA